MKKLVAIIILLIIIILVIIGIFYFRNPENIENITDSGNKELDSLQESLISIDRIYEFYCKQDSLYELENKEKYEKNNPVSILQEQMIMTLLLINLSKDNCKNYAINKTLCEQPEKIIKEIKDLDCQNYIIERDNINALIKKSYETKDEKSFVEASYKFNNWGIKRVLLNMGLAEIINLEPINYAGARINRPDRIIESETQAIEYYKEINEQYKALSVREIDDSKIKDKIQIDSITDSKKEEYFEMLKSTIINGLITDCKKMSQDFENELENNEPYRLSYQAGYIYGCSTITKDFYK